jgi:alanine transaminase
MFVINPNEPLGSVMTEDEMKYIIRFCYDNSLVLIAFETLQDAIHSPSLNFNSFRKVVLSMPGPYNNLELFSVHSTSKTPFFE